MIRIASFDSNVVMLENEMKELRDGDGFIENIGQVSLLTKKMNSFVLTAAQKAARFIALTQHALSETKAEQLLAVMGLLNGYTGKNSAAARRRLYFENGIRENTITDPDSLRRREDNSINILAVLLASEDFSPTFFDRVPQELVLPIPQYYEINPIELKAIDNRGQFALYIDRERQTTTTKSSLDYRSGSIPFCCRAKELSKIDAFCSDARAVLWWAITGGGGAGKSRLAHEYMLNHSSDNWKILFLREEFFAQVDGGGKYQMFNEWSYPTNLLVIIDYVQRYSGAVAQWIESVAVKKADGNKIRILLLERSGADGLWYKNFSDRHIVRQCCYAEPVELEALAPDELVQFAYKYAKAKGRTLSDVEIAKAQSDLKELDTEERILYFIMILDRIIEEKAEQKGVGRIDLLSYILEREIRDIRTRFNGDIKAFKNYMQMLIVATATTGISVNNPPEWLQEKCAAIFGAFPDATSAKRAMTAQDGILQPFAPDLIGEYLVLSSVAEYFPFDTDIGCFIKQAWDSNPDYLSDFLIRIKDDFGAEDKIIDVEWLKKILDGPITDNEPSFHVYFTLLSELSLFYHKPLLMSQEECARKMKAVHKRFQRDEYVVEHIKNTWYMCQAFNVRATSLIFVIDQIDTLVKNVPDSYEIICTCAQILHDISLMQTRRLDVYEEVKNGISTNIFELLCGQYDETGCLVRNMNVEPTMEDAQVLGKTAFSLYKIILVLTYFQKDNADIAGMFSCTASNSLRVLSDEQRDEIVNFVGFLAEKYDDMLIWKYYITGLSELAIVCDNQEKEKIIIHKIRNIAIENSDNEELVANCRECEELIINEKNPTD